MVTRWPTLHLPKLRFFEVRRDPNVVEINDLHQFLAGSDVLPDFHGTIADDAVHRGNNFCVLQVQCRLIEIRLLVLGFRQGRCSSGADDLHLLGGSIGVSRICTRLYEPALRLCDLLLSCIGTGARSFDARSTCLGRSDSLVVLLLGNFLLVD